MSLLTIAKNGVSLTAEPGFSERFKMFMSTHHARTASDHRYPELRITIYDVPSSTLKQHVVDNAKSLGWKLVGSKDSLENSFNNSSDNSHQLSFIVTTALFKFKDDIHIVISENSEGKSLLDIESKSRVGKADFGANLGHIMKLKNKLNHLSPNALY